MQQNPSFSGEGKLRCSCGKGKWLESSPLAIEAESRAIAGLRDWALQ
jgi:hypothetical protein